MKEEYLHYIFRTKQLGNTFKTTKGLKVEIINFGFHNLSSGPDFLECKLKLNNKIWAGQIEFHVKSSDWYKHKHQYDENYNNVIAHFVYEHDAEIKSGQYNLPTVELSNLIDTEHYNKYKSFINSKNWIACENNIRKVDSLFTLQQKEKALFNRLKRKSKIILDLISINNGDRKKVFFITLFKSFGTKVNQNAFETLGQKFDYKIISKLNNDAIKIQSYLFGLSGLLNDSFDDSFYNLLKAEYLYMKKLYSLEEMNGNEWKFSGLRPYNFPTIRLAQLSQVLSKGVTVNLEIDYQTIKNSYKIQLPEYWKQHYMFSRKGKRTNPNLTDSFIDLILINVYTPYLFAVGLLEDDQSKNNMAFSLLEKINPEKNNIISKWSILEIEIKSAFDTQALLEQKNEFCKKYQCLNCIIGQKLLKTE